MLPTITILARKDRTAEAVAFSRVSMGLTNRRKTAKNLVDSRKNR